MISENMKKIYKPGERFNAFQEKKRKHMKAVASVKMPKVTLPKAPKFTTKAPKVSVPKQLYPKSLVTKPSAMPKLKKHTKKRKVVANNARSMSLPGSMTENQFMPKYSPMNNSETTAMMAKRKHSKHRKHKKTIKTTGKFEGKSNALGHGGRAAQLKAQGVPGGVIGNLARAAHAAPGQANYHGKKKVHTKHEKEHHKGSMKHCKTCNC